MGNVDDIDVILICFIGYDNGVIYYDDESEYELVSEYRLFCLLFVLLILL
ncbi:hypothetical protein GCM10009021_32190 [Halarchaeum nitratireducens]|uniref:Uncharacterized protein n=2 Tax=Halobacteriaceae TaxID=2236 RepID=A0A830FGQ1_9EURY|nr:hypothetical protein GCM10009039_34900 [Halocalculus aciditolerans]GGN27143.1 hypothetical protein GCM10009021_32190 [Halarchaeum nitratireducens]